MSNKRIIFYYYYYFFTNCRYNTFLSRCLDLSTIVKCFINKMYLDYTDGGSYYKFKV